MYRAARWPVARKSITCQKENPRNAAGVELAKKKFYLLGPVEQLLEIIFTFFTLNVACGEVLPRVAPLAPVPVFPVWPAPALPEMLPALFPAPAVPLAELLAFPPIPVLELELLALPLRSDPLIRTSWPT